MNEAEIQQIKRQVASLEWYHTIDLGHGIVTPGDYDHRPFIELYGFPENLSGKTALDIGAASGFFAFEMEKRGAQVTATDLPEWMAHDLGPGYQPDKPLQEKHRYLHEPFILAKRILGSKVERHEINIYDISPQTVGTFDLVFCGSVLLHLTDPIKALWRIQSVTRKVAIISTGIYPDDSDVPLALFFGHHGGTTWWLPNRACLEALVQSAGFEDWEWFSEFRLDYRDGRPGTYHGVIRAWNTVEKYGPPVPEGTHSVTVQTREELARLRQTLAERDAEVACLREVVSGYERGRFIRLMRHIREWWGK